MNANDLLGRFGGSARAARLYEQLSQKQVRWGVAVMLALLLVPVLISTAQMHPYELSYYSEFVGGLRGATRLGLATKFLICMPRMASAASSA